MRYFVSIFLSFVLLVSVCFAYEPDSEGFEEPADISWPLIDGYEYVDLLVCSEDEYPDLVERFGCDAFYMYEEIDGAHIALVPFDLEISDGQLVVYVIDMQEGLELYANPTTPIETLASRAGGTWQAIGAGYLNE